MNPETPDDWQFAHFADEEEGNLFLDDPLVRVFTRRLNAQIERDHADTRRKNAAQREVYRRSPAMSVAFGGQLLPESEEDYAQALHNLMRSFQSDPLLLRYTNYLNHGPRGHPNTEWWHAFGHQQIATATIGAALTRREYMSDDATIRRMTMPAVWDARLFPPGKDDTPPFPSLGPREASVEWTGRALGAQTYLWTQECLDAALAAPLVPHVVEASALPFESLFFSFEMAAWQEQAVSVVDMSDQPVKVSAHAETWWCLISKVADAGMVFCFDKQLYPDEPGWQPQEQIVFEPIPWGARWPEDFPRRRFGNEIGAILRMLAFMQAPFVDASPSKRRLDRPARREYDRRGSPAPEPEVSIVTLRRALHEPLYAAPQEGDSESTRQYRHSWWVGGHYRWQYYPATDSHKLIAIAPYIKQKGKPMLKRLHHVAQ